MSGRREDSLLWIVLVVVAVVLVVPLLVMAVSMPMMGMMGWWSGRPGVGVSPLWGVGSVLLSLLVVAGVGYLLYRGLVGSRVLDGDPALEELRIAYARGDLSDEEFEERRRRLQRDRE